MVRFHDRPFCDYASANYWATCCCCCYCVCVCVSRWLSMLVHWVIVQTSSGGLFFVCGPSACRKVTLTKYGKNRQMARRVGKKSLKVSSPPPPSPPNRRTKTKEEGKRKRRRRRRKENLLNNQRFTRLKGRKKNEIYFYFLFFYLVLFLFKWKEKRCPEAADALQMSAVVFTIRLSAR